MTDIHTEQLQDGYGRTWFRLVCDPDPKVVRAIKKVPSHSRRFDQATGTWIVQAAGISRIRGILTDAGHRLLL